MPKKRSQSAISDDLEKAIFSALDEIIDEEKFETNKASAYYLHTTDNCLDRTIIIEPVGKTEDERVQNAKAMKAYFFNEEGIFSLYPRFDDKFHIMQNADRPVIKIKRATNQRIFLLPPDAAIGTLVIYGGLIATIFSKYHDYKNEHHGPLALLGLKSQGRDHVSDPEDSASEGEELCDENAQTLVSEEVHDQEEVQLDDDELQSNELQDDEIKKLYARLKEVKKRRVEVGAENTQLVSKEKKIVALTAKITEQEELLKTEEVKHSELTGRIKEKLSPYSAILKDSPLFRGLSTPAADKSAAATPSSAPPPAAAKHT